MVKMPWIDLETTGLDENVCTILEVGLVFTDNQLDMLYHKNWVLHATEEQLAQMIPYVRDMHTRSGLLDEVRESTLTLRDVEQELYDTFRDQYPNKSAVICGSSIHYDRRFIRKYMPVFEAILHYRMIDVSSNFEMMKAVYGIEMPRRDEIAHRSVPDCLQSIGYMKDFIRFINPNIIEEFIKMPRARVDIDENKRAEFNAFYGQLMWATSSPEQGQALRLVKEKLFETYCSVRP